MKKKIGVLLLVVISLLSVFGLTACSGSTKYVCETEGFTDEYIILMDNTQYNFYKVDKTEEGSYGFKGENAIIFRPYNPDLNGAEITQQVKDGKDAEVLEKIGQYSCVINGDIITVTVTVDGNKLDKVYKKV